ICGACATRGSWARPGLVLVLVLVLGRGGGCSGQWTVCVGLGEREKGGCGLLWTAVLEEGNGQLAVVVTAVVELVHLHGEGPSICLGSWTTSERRNN
ncbi:hypothetical protein COCVIDRAFT_89589, partial [Bipolaris victoriae FI3]